MNIPHNVETALESYMFNSSGSYGGTICTTYEANDAFNKTLYVPVYKNKTFFIPSLGISQSLEFLKNWIGTEDFLKYEAGADIGINLYVTRRAVLKTASTIINNINRFNSKTKLSHIDTKKGYIYYGGKGIILDENWNPLMIAGYYVDISGSTIIIKDPVCYISPEVFTNKDIVSKYLVNSIIPYLTQNSIYSAISRDCAITAKLSSKVTVIIQDIKDKIKNPVVPQPYNSNNDIWDFLDRNVDDLLCQ